MILRTIRGHVECEQIIKRSKFLGSLWRVQSVEQADEIIARIKKEHTFATHVCFAYIADILGNVARFCDDGEPSGTAGLPMLEVLKKSGLRQILAVCVRYFGGVKLGGGGLVRAYSGSVTNTLQACDSLSLERCDIYKLFLSYSTVYTKVIAEEIKREYNDNGLAVYFATGSADELKLKLESIICEKVELEYIDTDWIEIKN